jgi:hypothetical protein
MMRALLPSTILVGAIASVDSVVVLAHQHRMRVGQTNPQIGYALLASALD